MINGTNTGDASMRFRGDYCDSMDCSQKGGLAPEALALGRDRLDGRWCKMFLARLFLSKAYTVRMCRGIKIVMCKSLSFA
jgi:hypothetical protein